MLRSLTMTLMFWRRFQQLPSMQCSSVMQTENALTVNAFCSFSVDISKIRKCKSWVLYKSPVYVVETVSMLRSLGAKDSMIAQVFEHHPEAILCTPDHLEAQRKLWMSICSNHNELVEIIIKFPASFFTSLCHTDHQRANIMFFQSLGFNNRVIAKLMASAPQNFRRPIEKNEKIVQAFQKIYLELGGCQVNMRIWLQKLLTQNPNVLMKSIEDMKNNLNFLHRQGFTSNELLQLLSKLKGIVTELSPQSMALSLSYSQEMLACSYAELRQMVLRCPALLYYSVPILSDRFKCLLCAGIHLQQIMQTPTVLELTTQIVQYRIQKLSSFGYDIRTGSIDILNGTKKDFELSCGKFLRRERPHYNPVAPLRTDE